MPGKGGRTGDAPGESNNCHNSPYKFPVGSTNIHCLIGRMDGYYLGPGTHIYVKTFPESLRSLYKQFSRSAITPPI